MRDSTFYTIIAVLAILAAVIMAGVAFGDEEDSQFVLVDEPTLYTFPAIRNDIVVNFDVSADATLTLRIDVPTINEALTVYVTEDEIVVNSSLWPSTGKAKHEFLLVIGLTPEHELTQDAVVYLEGERKKE